MLFNAMGEMYGNKFTSEWGAFDATGAWWAELQHVTPGQLAIGVRRVRQQIQDAAQAGTEAWPPTPLAFAALCQPKPEDLGLPSDAQAWREATANAHQPSRHRWSHEAVRMAGQAVGWWDLTHVQPSQVARLESRFISEYRRIADSVTKGDWANPRLGHDSQLSKGALAERASSEAAQKRLEEEGMPDRMSPNHALRMMRAGL
ncbi:hypothetical protein CUU95_18345 [Vreelandella alkaliphila]|uniref:hypothetical protein n=1 Tax=Vreelandella alkaliphila TaxID=272774 RepID=UPI000EA00EEA|nr:hypothetical protein [Halomonas alkaliphila]AYF35653.1 hypothetical protein CUU95_18345 [Halomonas alkaliphila]